MRTDSFSQEKHLPVRRFIADESKVATGLYGPTAIAEDIDNIHAMFDPGAEILGGMEKGGIGEKNLQDGAVSEQKLAPGIREKLEHTASEKLLDDLRQELEHAVEKKAEKATTLSGYGITDAHTKEEIRELMSQWQNAEEFHAFQKEITEKLDQKTGETILSEVTVDTPVWKKQPTFQGAFDAAFNVTDFYYVTLKDASGNNLPAGQFMLKDTRAADATIYSTVFLLPDLATGEETLTENYPVEFIASGEMRSAGVWCAKNTMTNWMLKGNKGSVKITTIGEFVQMMNGATFTTVFTTKNNVSFYHSAHNTTSQNASSKQIIPFAGLSVGNYKANHFYDESILERNGDETFTFSRKGFLRYIKEGDTGYTVTDYDTVGYGENLTDTELLSVSIQASGSTKAGFIRNGSVIRISEVK